MIFWSAVSGKVKFYSEAGRRIVAVGLRGSLLGGGGGPISGDQGDNFRRLRYLPYSMDWRG